MCVLPLACSWITDAGGPRARRTMPPLQGGVNSGRGGCFLSAGFYSAAYTAITASATVSTWRAVMPG